LQSTSDFSSRETSHKVDGESEQADAERRRRETEGVERAEEDAN